MAFNFKLPGLGGKSSQGEPTISAPTVMEGGGTTKKSGVASGFLNQYSVTKQLQILGGALLLAVVLLGAIIFQDRKSVV